MLEIVENTVDSEGNKVAGRVAYLNEYGAKGVKTYDQFFEEYEESGVEVTELLVQRAKEENLGAGFGKQLQPAEVRNRLQQAREDAIENENFLNLIDEDIENGNIKPIPKDVRERVQKIKLAAENARRSRGD